MKHKPLGQSGPSASIVGLGAWVLGGGQLWGQDTDDAESVRPIQAALDLLASWQKLTDKYASPLAQWVIAWTAAQPGVTHVLSGGRDRAQVMENAKAGERNLEAADLLRICQDVIALGEPQEP